VVNLRARWLVALGCVGLVLIGWLVWAVWHTTPPSLPVMIGDLIAVVGLAVGPWLVLVGRQLTRSLTADSRAGVVFSRSMVFATMVGVGGPVLAVIALDEPYSPVLVLVSMVGSVLLALVGGIVLPWIYLLTRTITRERAARVRAEERAEISAHLHDSVLQALTLIQKRTEEPGVRRLARGTERELRAWLYGDPTARGDDFAAGVTAVTEEIEDRYDVLVELVTVGTCPLGGPASAVVGAIREALTNAAKHAGVRRVSVFAEAADAELLALVRDRGLGFDPSVHNGSDRRGIAESIDGRMRQHGGTATIRSAPGKGTEVELRMPLVVFSG
jgi:signal transduction histidine kinase